MTRMVSMLRGVNVAGHNIVKMSELGELYKFLGFKDVTTYLQSGNVVFSYASKDTATFAAKIQKAMKVRLGLDATVFTRTSDALRNVVARNPFAEENPSKLHVTFLRTRPVTLPMDKLKELRDRFEELAIKDREVYLFLPNGIGRSKLSNNFLEKMLGIQATTRNWNTVRALLELSTNKPK